MALGTKKKYKSKAQQSECGWLNEDRLALLEGWSRDGYTYDDIAAKMGISRNTLFRWRNNFPEIDNALSKGREVIDYRVENALLKAALGYKTTETKVTIETNRRGEVISTLRETTEREFAPNVTACQVWLYNRLPQKWKRNRDKVLELSDEDSGVQITVVRADDDNKESEGSERVNKEISIKPSKTSRNEAESKNKGNSDDVDYWPEDWEDD